MDVDLRLGHVLPASVTLALHVWKPLVLVVGVPLVIELGLARPTKNDGLLEGREIRDPRTRRLSYLPSKMLPNSESFAGGLSIRKALHEPLWKE